MLDLLLTDFDSETNRYRHLVEDPRNPVGRVRIGGASDDDPVDANIQVDRPGEPSFISD
jgi:hypothetical protein